MSKVDVNRRNIGVWCRLVEDDSSSDHIVGGKGGEDFFPFDIDIHPLGLVEPQHPKDTCDVSLRNT